MTIRTTVKELIALAHRLEKECEEYVEDTEADLEELEDAQCAR